jgi:HIV Tat-specific factor 1
VIQIKFKTPTAAANCIQLMNGRFFAGSKISCFFWDGKTDYKKPPETEEEVKQRIEDFGKWLEGDKVGQKDDEEEEENPEDEPEEKEDVDKKSEKPEVKKI